MFSNFCLDMHTILFKIAMIISAKNTFSIENALVTKQNFNLKRNYLD
jgi:hypothetical protein